MKSYFTIISLVLASLAHGDPASSLRDEFLSRLKTVAQSQEQDRYLQLVCTDGLSQPMLKAARTQSEYVLSEIKRYGDDVKFEWTKPTQEILEIPEANGFRYIPNLKIEEALVISWRDTLRNSDVQCTMALGIKNGRLMQVGTIKQPVAQQSPVMPHPVNLK